jgi:hypothetical protein
MTKIALLLLLLIAVFLGGFLPERSKVNRLEDDLREARRQTALAKLRDLSGLTYIQASQKNYGLASKTSAAFFGLVQEVASQTADAAARKPYEELLGMREKITAELAKGDAEVMNDLHPLYLKTQQSK